MWSPTQKMWLTLLHCLKSVARDIQDLSASHRGDPLAEGREDALLPGEESLAEATVLCTVVRELAKLLPSPEDDPHWHVMDFIFFLLNLTPAFQSAAACSLIHELNLIAL